MSSIAAMVVSEATSAFMMSPSSGMFGTRVASFFSSELARHDFGRRLSHSWRCSQKGWDQISTTDRKDATNLNHGQNTRANRTQKDGIDDMIAISQDPLLQLTPLLQSRVDGVHRANTCLPTDFHFPAGALNLLNT